jgi:hypothetical protein
MNSPFAASAVAITMMKFLAEDAIYKVYALAENVYLKLKAQSSKPDEFEKGDLHIAYHYGAPTAALLLRDYVIVAGCGLTIFDFKTQQETALFCEPGYIKWTNGLHRDELDDLLEFRYVSWAATDKLRVFKMNARSHKVLPLD